MIKIESHIADVRIKISARSLKDLFIEGMKGMYAILRPAGEVRSRSVDLIIRLDGPDKTLILVDFLNEILSHSLVNRCVYHKLRHFRYHDDTLEVTLSGYKVHSFSTEVKAVTFHEAEIREISSGRLQTTLILDI